MTALAEWQGVAERGDAFRLRRDVKFRFVRVDFDAVTNDRIDHGDLRR